MGHLWGTGAPPCMQMRSFVCGALLAFAAAVDDVCEFSDTTWTSGGTCTCPSGETYLVSDHGDMCGNLACKNGTSGECQNYPGQWSNIQVNCGLPGWSSKSRASGDTQLEPQNCKESVTVAYTFITRATLPYWDVWRRYFATCPDGSALPVVHSQDLSDKGRAKMELMLATYRGRLLEREKTRLGNPRFSFLMVSIQLALWRAAGEAVAPNGCAPQWFQLLSERDLPASSCADVHGFLGAAPGVSHFWYGSEQQVPEEITPLAKHSQWVLLARPAALALAADDGGSDEKVSSRRRLRTCRRSVVTC